MKKNILIVMFSNLISLIVGLVSNFLLPHYLSIEAYAIIKTYTLYMTYASFFSLGFVDGMYLEYGGKNYNEINREKLKTETVSFICLEGFFFLIILLAGIISKRYLLIFFGAGMMSNALTGYFRSFFQAVGEFKKYGKSLNIEKIVLLVLYLVMIFGFSFTLPYPFILVQIIVPFFIIFYLKKGIFTKNDKIGKIYFTNSIHYIPNGFVLMISNFSLGILTGIDRWFIKIFMDNINFAMYSFAVSTESIISVFLSPITVSMYNYFCKKTNDNNIRRIKNMCTVWGFLVITAAFPCKWIVQHFLGNYILSLDCIFILFLSQVYTIIVRGIYVNIYKAEQQQKYYFKQVILFIVIAAIINFIFIMIYKSIASISLATLFVSILWMIFCEFSYKKYKFSKMENFYLIFMSGIFLSISKIENSVLAVFIYICSYIVLNFIFMKKEFIEMLYFIINILKKKLLRNMGEM